MAEIRVRKKRLAGRLLQPDAGGGGLKASEKKSD